MPSLEAVASSAPLGENATKSAVRRWPPNARFAVPLSTSHRRTVPSAEAVARSEPSGEKRTRETAPDARAGRGPESWHRPSKGKQCRRSRRSRNGPHRSRTRSPGPPPRAPRAARAPPRCARPKGKSRRRLPVAIVCAVGEKRATRTAPECPVSVLISRQAASAATSALLAMSPGSRSAASIANNNARPGSASICFPAIAARRNPSERSNSRSIATRFSCSLRWEIPNNPTIASAAIVVESERAGWRCAKRVARRSGPARRASIGRDWRTLPRSRARSAADA